MLRRDAFRTWLRSAWPGLCVFVLGVAVCMLWPRRGEWIVGGLDPGVYVNRGVDIARVEGFSGEPDPAYRLLDARELPPFTRNFATYVESFPAVPLELSTRAPGHYFFRLTHVFAASWFRCGGLRAVTRFNLMAGLFVVFAFSALLVTHGLPWLTCFFFVLILVSRPLWVYHLQYPVSEMLQLFLVCGIGALLPFRRQGAWTLGLLGVSCAAAVMNRISFLPFGGLLALLMALQDAVRCGRRRVSLEHLVVWAGLALGLAYDLAFCRVTVACLGPVTKVLLTVAGAALGLTLTVDAAAGSPAVRRHVAALDTRPWRWWAAAAVSVMLAAACLPAGRSALVTGVSHAGLLMPFLGWSTALAALAGAGWLLVSTDSAWRDLRLFMLFLLGAALISLLHQHIAALYPYATRRHLAYATPAAVLGAGLAVRWLWMRQGKPGRLLAVVGLAVLLVETARPAWHAWSRTEYDGLSRVLKRAASQIDDRDVVLVDHPWWGMPLRFIYGLPVLNGKSFYSRPGPDTMEQGMAALARLRQQGRRIRFLTSTERGLEVFPLEVAPVRLDWSSDRVRLAVIMQGSEASGFRVRYKHKVFRLYTWGD